MRPTLFFPVFIAAVSFSNVLAAGQQPKRRHGVPPPSATTPAAPQTNELVVDFSKVIGPATQRASGALLGMTAQTPAQFIEPLKFRTWRSMPMSGWLFDPVMVTRLQQMGTRPEVLCSTGALNQRIKATGHWPGDGGNWSEYERELAATVKEARKTFAGFPSVEYDIWNEPDSKQFWLRTLKQWYETYKRGVGVVRKEHPGALVAGPSFTYFRVEQMHEFLLFAHAHHVMPDVLTWHDLYAQVSPLGPQITALKTWAEKERITLPERFEVNEIGGEGVKTLPAIFPVYFAVAERQQIWGACKSSWAKPERNYTHKDLGQMLTPENQPRSVWWVYKAYADITGQIVNVLRSGAGCDAVAGYDTDDGTARLLVGCGGPEVPLPFPLEVSLRGIPAALLTGSSVHVQVAKIRDSGDAPSQGPEQIRDEMLPVNGGEASLQVGNWAGRRDALSIRLIAAGKSRDRP